jgi:threonine/homoserine/homoserine lactone efflux protein
VVPLENILTFIAFALVIIAIPGPSVMFAISRALVLGKRGAVLTVVGNGIGVLVQALAVSVGLGVLIESNEFLMHTIRLAGAAFLMYLGVTAIRRRRDGLDLTTPVDVPKSSHVLRESLLVGLSNPKTIVFFSAAFPQFVVSDGAPIVFQMMILSVIFVFFGISGDAIYALSAGAARDWFAKSPSRVVSMRTVGGVAMTTLGVVTAIVPA